MSKEGEKAFDNAEVWEQYELYTDEDGVRFINVGVYIYCAEMDIEEEDGPRTWRQVNEFISIPLTRMLRIIGEGETLWDQPEADARPSDEIEDLTEDEARERFVHMYDSNPRLDFKDIRLNSPDGVYFGVTV